MGVMRLGAGRAWAIVLVGLAFHIATPCARAAPDEPKPWAAGVSEDHQARALRLFEDGNRLFEESQYGAALAKYRDALAVWNHPMIHFNMSVCFIHLDQPVSAHEHLTQALAYGEAPLGATLHGQALTYQKLLMGRLAHLEVKTQQTGVDVSLDGKPLFTGPGAATRVVLPGTHQLVARKRGFLTDARTVNVEPGKRQLDNLVLVPVPHPVERRWRSWTPWLVVGSGTAVALVGVGLQARAGSNLDRYDQRITDLCPSGCAPEAIPESVRDIKDRGQLQNRVAIVAIAGGGAVALLGGILVLLNQPRTVSITESQRGPERAASARPVVRIDGTSVSLSLSF